MKPHAILVSGALAVAAAAIVFGIVAGREARRTRSMLAEATASWHSDLQRVNERIEKPATPAGAEGDIRDPLQGDTRNAGDNRAAAARQYQQDLAKQRAQEAKALAEMRERTLFLPEVQQAAFKTFAAGVSRRYRALYATLGWPGEAIARFERLQQDRYWAVSDFAAAAQAQKLSPADPAHAEARRRALEPIDEQLRAALGPAGYDAYSTYERSAPERALVESAAGALAADGESLTVEQIDRLTAILAAHGPQSSETRDADAWLELVVRGREPPGADWAEVNWRTASVELPSFLSDAQRALLEQIHQQALLRREAGWSHEDAMRELRLQLEELRNSQPRTGNQ